MKAPLEHSLPAVLILPAETPATLGQYKFKVDLKGAKETPVDAGVLAYSCLAVYLAGNFFANTLSKLLCNQVFAPHILSSNLGTVVREALHSIKNCSQPVIDSIVINNENYTSEDTCEGAEQSTNIS